MFDYHHHSAASIDSTASLDDICAVAVARGVSEVAFTEHMDFIPEEANTGYFDYDSCRADIDRARRRWEGRVALLLAVEVDYCPDFEDEIAAWLGGKEFDYVVGSVHYLRGRGNISEPRAAEWFGKKPVDEAYADYFSIVRRSAETGLWDALGHLDLVKRYGVRRYGPFDPAPFAADVDAALRAIIGHGIALEINSSGLRQDPGEPYPGPAILRRFRELGGERITVGSDAHHAGDTGRNVADTLRIARDLGFSSVERFRSRRGERVPLGDLV